MALTLCKHDTNICRCFYTILSGVRAQFPEITNGKGIFELHTELNLSQPYWIAFRNLKLWLLLQFVAYNSAYNCTSSLNPLMHWVSIYREWIGPGSTKRAFELATEFEGFDLHQHFFNGNFDFIQFSTC